jgi:hypothetical protein
MPFSDALLKEVLANLKNDHHDNYDPMMRYESRFWEDNAEGSFFNTFLHKKLPINPQLDTTPRWQHYFYPRAFYRQVIHSLQGMSLLYDLLSDEASQALMSTLLAYRILGYKRVKLPRNSPGYWNDIETLKALDVGHGAVNITFANLQLPLLDLSSLGYDIRLNATPMGSACIFTQRQYDYYGKHAVCRAGNPRPIRAHLLVENGPTRGWEKGRGFPAAAVSTCSSWRPSWPSSTPGSGNFHHSSQRCGICA